MMLGETINKVFQMEVEKDTEDTKYIQINKYKMDSKEYKNLRQIIYYILSGELNTYLQEHQQVNEGFRKIQEQLIDSKISFKDIYTTLRWFNSELIRHPKSPFYFDTSTFKPDFKDVLKEMHGVDALVICAHPFAYFEDKSSQEEYINNLMNHIEGIDGMEEYYAYGDENIEKKIDIIKAHCNKEDMILGTGGTDYHTLQDTIGVLKNGYKIHYDQIDKNLLGKAISIEEFEKNYSEQYYDTKKDEVER